MNEKTKSIIFQIAGFLLFVGAGTYLLKWDYADYCFAAGAAGFAFYYLTTPYKGSHIRNKRLHRFHIFASVLILVTSTLLFKDRNEWAITLLIAAFLEMYVSFAWTDESKKDS